MLNDSKITEIFLFPWWNVLQDQNKFLKDGGGRESGGL